MSIDDGKITIHWRDLTLIAGLLAGTSGFSGHVISRQFNKPVLPEEHQQLVDQVNGHERRLTALEEIALANTAGRIRLETKMDGLIQQHTVIEHEVSDIRDILIRQRREARGGNQ